MSPSKLDKSCNGYASVLRANLDAQQATDDGVTMHRLLEQSILQRKTPETVDMSHHLSSDQVAMVSDAYRYIVSTAGAHDHISSEVDIDLTEIAGYKQSGRSDVVIKSNRHAVVIDAKFGPGHRRMSASESKQLITYAAGIALSDASIESIKLVIMQPVLSHISESTIGRQDAIRTAKSFYVRSECDPGSSCEKCDLGGSCGARARHNVSHLPGILLDVVSMSDENISDVMQSAQKIINWAEDVKEEARKRAEIGATIEGFTLVDGKSRRTWIDDSTAQSELTRLAVEKGITDKVVVPISPAVAEKLLGADSIVSIVKTQKMPPLLVKNFRQ